MHSVNSLKFDQLYKKINTIADAYDTKIDFMMVVTIVI
jgi:hypothetical protein